MHGCATYDPRAVYDELLKRHMVKAGAWGERSRRLSWARLAVAIVAIAVGVVVSESDLLQPLWVLPPVAAFVVLVIWHSRVIQAERRSDRLVAFYRRGLKRLSGEWPGEGPDGSSHTPQAHPYAADLDVLGPGSLFQLLCTCRTAVGEDVLAHWLLHPAPPAEVRARQEAVAELAPRLELREELALLGDEVARSLRGERLVAWSKDDASQLPGWWSPAAFVLTAATTLTALAWATGAWPRWPLLVAVIALLLLRWSQRRWVETVAAAAQAPARELGVVAAVLQRFESEPASAPLLGKLQEALVAGRSGASGAVARLARLVERLDYRRNMMFAPLELLSFWTFHSALAIDRWRRRWGRKVEQWLAAGGELEALTALAGYAWEHSEDVFPDIQEGKEPLFAAEGLAHPLLPEGVAVRNDVTIGGQVRALVVSGSNMSGKSTLLRAVGQAAVLAQAGAPVRARRLRLSPLAVGASIRIVDSLLAGRSRFYAEISRLKEIVDLLAVDVGVLFLLDEIFHGTNSHDRRVGAEALVGHLVKRGALGLLTTHDLALARLSETLAPAVRNVHFQDTLESGELHFDFVLRRGTVERSNALALMRSVGLPVDEEPG